MTNTPTRILLVAGISALLVPHLSFAENHTFKRLVKTMKYGELIRATVKSGCVQNDPYSTPSARIRLCEKIDRIPDEVIEAAAKPFFDRHISEQSAKAEIAYRTSEPGKSISEKLLNEISTGRTHLLSDKERKLSSTHNATKGGREFLGLAADPLLGQALANALIQYEP